MLNHLQLQFPFTAFIRKFIFQTMFNIKNTYYGNNESNRSTS